MYENKEEALRELTKIIDEYGIGYNELKENYSSEKTVNTKKKVPISSTKYFLKFSNIVSPFISLTVRFYHIA